MRVEPWLNRAVAFAKGTGLVEQEGGSRIKLTEQGMQALKAVSAVETVLIEEKAFLNAVGTRATEAMVEKIMRMEPSL